jgi:hypothetical protein
LILFQVISVARPISLLFEKVTAKTCAGLIRKTRDVEDAFWRDDAAFDEQN